MVKRHEKLLQKVTPPGFLVFTRESQHQKHHQGRVLQWCQGPANLLGPGCLIPSCHFKRLSLSSDALQASRTRATANKVTSILGRAAETAVRMQKGRTEWPLEIFFTSLFAKEQSCIITGLSNITKHPKTFGKITSAATCDYRSPQPASLISLPSLHQMSSVLGTPHYNSC